MAQPDRAVTAYPRLSGRAGEINMDMEVLRGRRRLDNKNLP